MRGNIPIVSSAGVTDYHNTSMVNPPGVVTGRYGTIGELFYLAEPFWPLNTTLYVRDFHGNDPRFIFYHLQRFNFATFSGKSGVPGVNRNDLHAETVNLPVDVAEQRAIATALSDVDALLDHLDLLIAKKRDLKQAAIQQLISGKTRMPGFTGNWKIARLGDLGQCLRGVSYRGDSDLSAYDTPNTTRLLRANNIQDTLVTTTDVQFVDSRRVSADQILKTGDIVICMANGSKALVGKAARFSIRDGFAYTFGAFMGCFRPANALVKSEFLQFLFQTLRYRNYINDLLAGSSINNLRPNSIELMEYPMPELSEQAAIATVLSDMDAELAALEARRNKTRALKQAMMQELLTGRIRLV